MTSILPPPRVPREPRALPRRTQAEREARLANTEWKHKRGLLVTLDEAMARFDLVRAEEYPTLDACPKEMG